MYGAIWCILSGWYRDYIAAHRDSYPGTVTVIPPLHGPPVHIERCRPGIEDSGVAATTGCAVRKTMYSYLLGALRNAVEGMVDGYFTAGLVP